jgi:cyclophilin family peptidyl-prolyl cis-trans isomerase
MKGRHRWVASQAVRSLLALVGLLVALVLVAGCGGGEDESSGTTASSGTSCEEVAAPAARDPGSHEAPSQPLDTGTTYTLTFKTSCGSFAIMLDLEKAPNTTASLVALAEDGYFDETIFHRVVPGFVIQGGDPSQTGGGGPGYSTVDPPPSDAAYTKGVVAMAKTEAEPAGTSGSQFFVVTGADAGLTPDYALVGEVTEGMDTVERIDALGVGNGPPSQTVVIESVTVGRS